MKLFERKILDHGKSFGVTLPKKELQRKGFKAGDIVDISIKKVTEEGDKFENEKRKIN